MTTNPTATAMPMIRAVFFDDLTPTFANDNPAPFRIRHAEQFDAHNAEGERLRDEDEDGADSVQSYDSDPDDRPTRRRRPTLRSDDVDNSVPWGS